METIGNPLTFDHEMNTLICPTCKESLDGESSGYSCAHCRTSYPVVDGIPLLLPASSSAFKDLERDYWDQRFASEGELSQLVRMYQRGDEFDDSWGILDYVKKIVALVPEGATTLEIGAGLNSQVIPMALAHGYNALVTDLSVKSLLKNRQAVSAIDGKANIDYYAVDADYLPFEDNTMDVVLLHATLHHLPDPQNTLREITRCLRVGGLLVLGHEPNRRVFEPLRTLADKLHITERYTQRFVEGSYSVADEETPGFFGKELRDWLAENNMKIEWMEPIWFSTAVVYNLPTVTNLAFSRRVNLPPFIRRISLAADERVFAKVPGVRELSLFWSVGAHKR